MSDADAFERIITALAEAIDDLLPVDAVVGIESRGFVLGAPLAMHLGVGFVPIRKAGKLPAETVSATYSLEYGEATIEMHEDALPRDSRVLVVDDVLATGGTLVAAGQLLDHVGVHTVAQLVMIELPALNGRDNLRPDAPLRSLHSF